MFFSCILEKMNPKRNKYLYSFSKPPYQLKPPINCLKRAEVQEIINSLNPKKSSGYDLVMISVDVRA
jgi:hypothetical protein